MSCTLQSHYSGTPHVTVTVGGVRFIARRIHGIKINNRNVEPKFTTHSTWQKQISLYIKKKRGVCVHKSLVEVTLFLEITHGAQCFLSLFEFHIDTKVIDFNVDQLQSVLVLVIVLEWPLKQGNHYPFIFFIQAITVTKLNTIWDVLVSCDSKLQLDILTASALELKRKWFNNEVMICELLVRK